MIDRYFPRDLAEIWSDENKFRSWLKVEVEVCRVLAEKGWIPAASMENIERNANFSLERIAEIENKTHHDLIAFTTSVAESVGPDSRFIHWGLTSTDVVDTAQALQLRATNEIILKAIDEFMEVLARRAKEHRRTLIMGRTHGVHAEVTTFGLKVAVWYDEMRRNRERMRRAAEVVNVGKISGAVGTFAHLDPDVEARVCERLGIKAASISTQTLQRDRHSEYLSTIAIVGSSLEKFASEIRHLQRTEVRRRRALCCRPEGLIGYAPQAQPGQVRTSLRPVPALAWICDHGAGGWSALARARHLSLIGGACDPARCDGAPLLHAADHDLHCRRSGGLSRANVEEHGTDARTGLLGSAPSGYHQEGGPA
jgi:hypothetical protein